MNERALLLVSDRRVDLPRSTSTRAEIAARFGTMEEIHIDTLEYGAERDGQKQSLDSRLFMQLVCFSLEGGPRVAAEIVAELKQREIPSVLYASLNDPKGFGLLTWSEDPAHFATKVRGLFAEGVLEDASVDPSWTMLGRTYASGYERDLRAWLIDRPIANATAPEADWAVWYPLRRKGAFAKLEPREQGRILGEHAIIGKAYGKQGLANDVRLSCYGIDAHDNDFVIGLIGKELHPLSHVVQSMRKTRQTSEFIEVMGPFFVGHRIFAQC